jgi:hypothetical protein
MADDYKTPAYYHEHENDPSIPDLRNSINSNVDNQFRKEWHPAFTEKYERPIRYFRKNPTGEDYGQQIAELRKSVDDYFIFTVNDDDADTLFKKHEAIAHEPIEFANNAGLPFEGEPRLNYPGPVIQPTVPMSKPTQTQSVQQAEVLEPKVAQQTGLFDPEFEVKTSDKDKHKGGLGQSLSSIISEEESAIKNVRYFDDK